MRRIEARVWTALAGIPVVLLLVAAGGLWFRGFCLLLALIAMRELQRAFKSSGDYGRAPLVGEVAYPATAYAVCFGPSALWAISIVVALGILAVLFGGREEQNGPRLSLASLCTTLFCTFYVSLFALLPPLRSPASSSSKWFWLVLLLVWTGDTLAYYGGKRFGKHPLSPLSPKKTREGFLIGLLATTLAAPLLAHLFHLPTERALAMGAVVGIAAPVGDLLESFLKRELGVKDLGNLLPGHGGVLDRCDSLLFAAFAALLVLGAH
ncbi:phosphatidate cytidylyltransferase [Abditibacteriota bacterium]|nr:phosphatidate cytidylyltransferase [Abditibacteriota bacterium]